MWLALWISRGEKMIKLEVGSCYFNDVEDWTTIKSFFFLSESKSDITVSDIEGDILKIPKRLLPSLHLHPVSYPKDSEVGFLFSFLRDMASSIVRQFESLNVDRLIEILSQDGRVELSRNDLVFYLKSLVANGSFIADYDRRKKIKETFLTLGAGLRELEKQRTFAASIASELDALSSRIRLIISHSGTVGTYRENLLQNVLRKHLPERYHVATGFIYGCTTQLDILIYDRLEYAPLFREGDLVVIPANAARAVIEVKTNLTAEETRKSLQLLSAVARQDDGLPPIFKGIFAFESDLSQESLVGVIKHYYVGDLHSEENEADLIIRAYDHLTCVCVLEKHFAHVQYDKDAREKLRPTLYAKKSHTDLKSQAAFFMHSLLAHLRFGGMKSNSIRYMEHMLGYDPLSKYQCDLVNGDWGPYFMEAEGMPEGPEMVKSMECQIEKVRQWLEGVPMSWDSE